TIWKKIVTRYNGKASKRVGGVVVQVGVQGGAKPQKGDHDTGHWRLLEFGTSQMAAQPSMRPALESNVQAVTDKLISDIGPQIDRAVERAKRRASGSLRFSQSRSLTPQSRRNSAPAPRGCIRLARLRRAWRSRMPCGRPSWACPRTTSARLRIWIRTASRWTCTETP